SRPALPATRTCIDDPAGETAASSGRSFLTLSVSPCIACSLYSTQKKSKRKRRIIFIGRLCQAASSLPADIALRFLRSWGNAKQGIKRTRQQKTTWGRTMIRMTRRDEAHPQLSEVPQLGRSYNAMLLLPSLVFFCSPYSCNRPLVLCIALGLRYAAKQTQKHDMKPLHPSPPPLLRTRSTQKESSPPSLASSDILCFTLSSLSMVLY
ncbi:hypothetical protein L249_2640, partial [Ophiocordyceps polyrhachis-furcata BCC 54312]